MGATSFCRKLSDTFSLWWQQSWQLKVTHLFSLSILQLSPTPSNNAEPPAYSETRNGRGSAEAAASSPEPLTEAEGQSNQDLSDRMANSTLNGDNNPRADMGILSLNSIWKRAAKLAVNSSLRVLFYFPNVSLY